MSREADSKLRNAGEKGSKPSVTSGNGGVWRGYINVTLNASQKAQYDDWCVTDDPWLALDESTSSGCHLGLKYLGGEKCFMASLTQRAQGHVNEGLCVTARSSDAIKAVLRVLFLYRVLGGNSIWELVKDVADPDRW